MLMIYRFCLSCIVLALCFSCTNTSRFSYKQVDLTDEEIQIALAKAPSSYRDSTITLALGERYNKHALHRWVWGNRYRELWSVPVTFEVLDLGQEGLGLKPVKRGGGFQTKSLKLEDKDGNEYALRSVDKEPATALPKFLRSTFIAGVVRDQTAAMHPYGPLVVPGLAKAAGVYFHDHKYVFVPYDPRLGQYVKEYAGMVAMLETRIDESHPDIQKLGKIIDVENTQDVLEKRFASHRQRIDQRMFAKARLFDIWIGDWDRHEGQWNWAEIKRGKGSVFKPIPKDRDQVFYRLDGWFSWLITRVGPLRKLEVFDKDEINVKNYAYNARFIDKRMLNELTRQDWDEIADSLQNSLTDTAIANALKALPEPVYSKNAPEMMEILQARRKQLPTVARKFYLLLASKVEIPGSHEKDKFVVNRLSNEQTLVEVFSIEKGSKSPEKVFSRVFNHSETKKLYLYGLRGDDEFEVTGEVKKGILVNIIGGMGVDKVTDSSRVGGWGRKTRVYDTKHGVEIDGGKETRVKTSKSVKVHAYDEEGL